jgi:hypothetical protein
MANIFLGRRGKEALLLISCFLFCASIVSAVEVQVKISGSFSYLALGNVNRVIEDWANEQKMTAQLNPNWAVEGEVLKKFHSGFSFESELLIKFTRRIALGLGTGYIYADIVEDNTAITIRKGDNSIIYVRPTKVSALPLRLSGYYFLPLKDKLQLFFRGGMGLLWAKYVDREGNRNVLEKTFAYPTFQMATAPDLSFHGGLGASYEFESGVGLFAEAGGCLAKVGGFEGEIKSGEKGTLYSYEEYSPTLNFWQSKLEIRSEEPSGVNVRSAQEAVINFSNLSLRAGLQFKF